MAVKKIEIRPKGTGDYADILYPKTSTDMVFDDATGTTVATHMADYVKHPGAATSTNTGNAYVVTLNPAPNSYVANMGVVVTVNADATGAATLNVNGLGAKPILKSNGNAVSNLKANGVYTVRYNPAGNGGTGAFILQGEGASGNAVASDLRSGKTASTDAGDVVGTLDLTNLIPSNIKKDINIGGVTGTFNDIPWIKGTLKNNYETQHSCVLMDDGTIVQYGVTSGKVTKTVYDKNGNILSNNTSFYTMMAGTNTIYTISANKDIVLIPYINSSQSKILVLDHLGNVIVNVNATQSASLFRDYNKTLQMYTIQNGTTATILNSSFSSLYGYTDAGGNISNNKFLSDVCVLIASVTSTVLLDYSAGTWSPYSSTGQTDTTIITWLLNMLRNYTWREN